MDDVPKSKTDDDLTDEEWSALIAKDPIKALCDMLKSANMRMTFDLERDITKPCVDCGTTTAPRDLVDIGWDDVRKDDITRPLCSRCIMKRGITTLRKPRG